MMRLRLRRADRQSARACADSPSAASSRSSTTSSDSAGAFSPSRRLRDGITMAMNSLVMSGYY